MEKIIILAILIVIMEFAVEAIKAILKNIPVWKNIKAIAIPIINITCMSLLTIGTGITILDALVITCNPIWIDYVFTVLVTSLGTTAWHEFKKKIKEVTKKDGDSDEVQ
jgi:hypothetical protein